MATTLSRTAAKRMAFQAQRMDLRLLRCGMVPAAIFLLALATVVAVPMIYGLQYPRSVASVFDDVVTYGHLSALVGFLSDLGITLWIAMAVLLAQAFHRRLGDAGAVSREEKAFYFCTISLLLFLAMDDRLLIHEWLNEEKGVPKALIMGAYGAMVLACGMRFRRHLLGGFRMWLWLALAAFGLSEMIDLNLLGSAVLFASAGAGVMEEAFKWLGICALFLHIFTLTTRPAAR